MKANFLKLTLFISFLLVGIGINAQTQPQTLCSLEEKTYTVDDDPTATPPITPSPDGSYTWTLTNDAGTGDFSSAITVGQGTNSVTIDWAMQNSSNENLFDYGTYTLTVVESNIITDNNGDEILSCSGTPQTLTISLIEGYLPPSITEFSPADICNLDADNDGNHDNEVFTLTGGTIGAILTYKITSDVNGVVVASTTVTLDATDTTATPTNIPVPALANANITETFTLTLTSIDNDPSTTDDCDAFTVPTPSMTDSGGNTIITQTSVTVNPIPTTTPIGTN